MDRRAFTHGIDLRVRWAEVDMQGVVFNGHYLTYCDVCITEYWRAIGLRYPQAAHALGIDFVVRKSTVEYLQPARYDDELRASGRVAQIGRTSLRFAVELLRAGAQELLIRAELVYVCVAVDAAGAIGAAVAWPAPVIDLIRRFELAPPLETASETPR